MPSVDPASSEQDDSSDAKQTAAAAEAARAAAIRALLDAPPDAYVPAAARMVPSSSSALAPFAPAEEPSLPVAPRVERDTPYTVLEVSLGSLVLILASVFAFAGVREYQSRARAVRSAAELRALAAACEQHHASTGEWPAAAAPGTVPAGLEKSADAELWIRPAPLGGHYGWLIGAENRPALGITAFVPDAPLNLSRQALERIDRLLDDGNLTTGRFRARFNGWPVYFLTDSN